MLALPELHDHNNELGKIQHYFHSQEFNILLKSTISLLENAVYFYMRINNSIMLPLNLVTFRIINNLVNMRKDSSEIISFRLRNGRFDLIN